MDPLASIGCQHEADIRLDEAALHLAAADRPKADLRPDIAWLDSLAARLPKGLVYPAAGGGSGGGAGRGRRLHRRLRGL